MLRLVHPSPGGNGPPAPARRRRPAPSLSLTEDEARHARTAIRGAARVLGSLAKLAALIGVRGTILTKKSRPHPGLVLAVSRVAKLSLDAMLSGKLVDAGTCPSCGAKRVPLPGGAS
jgi:hypothetical protein